MKKPSLKKLLALLMAGTMIASFAACDNTDTDADTDTSGDSDVSGDTDVDTDSDDFNMDGDILLNEPGEYPIVQDGQDVTLSVWCSPQLETCQDFTAEVNPTTAWYEEKTNVSFDWTVVSKADKTTKLNLVFTDTAYPDMIWGSSWDGASQVAYSEAGFIVPLTEYYEGGDAYWFDALVADGYEVDNGMISDEILKSMYMPDGEVYSMYQFVASYHNKWPYKMWIYEPWLEEVGMDMPTTTEEYYDVLTAFKNEDPNGNGKADEIPVTGSPDGWNTNPINFLMNSFVYYGATNQRYVSVDNGEVVFTPVQEGFRTGLEYLAKLDDEELLITDTWTQDANSLKSLTTGEVNLVGSAPGGSIGSVTVVYDREEGDWTNWVALDPLEGPDGVQYSMYLPSYPLAMFQITNNCEYPKIAFRIGDAMYDTESYLNMKVGYGEGVYWEYAEEGEVGLDGNQAYYLNLGSDANTMDENYGWGQINHVSCLAGWHTGMVADEDTSIQNEAILYNSTLGYAVVSPDDSMIIPPLVFGEDIVNDVIDTKKVIDDYLLVEMVGLIMDGVTDDSWNNFVSDLEASGYEKLLSYYQDAYEVFANS